MTGDGSMSSTRAGHRTVPCQVVKYRISDSGGFDFTGVFDDILKEDTMPCELVRVKTKIMGSMLRLIYNLTLRTRQKGSDRQAPLKKRESEYRCFRTADFK